MALCNCQVIYWCGAAEKNGLERWPGGGTKTEEKATQAKNWWWEKISQMFCFFWSAIFRLHVWKGWCTEHHVNISRSLALLFLVFQMWLELMAVLCRPMDQRNLRWILFNSYNGCMRCWYSREVWIFQMQHMWLLCEEFSETEKPFFVQEEDDEFAPENVTFAPKDVIPVDFTPKVDSHGLGYRGLNPLQALGGESGSGHINLFTIHSDRTTSLFGDRKSGRQRRGGIGGQVTPKCGAKCNQYWPRKLNLNTSIRRNMLTSVYM